MISREGKMRFDSVCLWAILLPLAVGACDSIADASATWIRLIVETDAGGDPDDEQSSGASVQAGGNVPGPLLCRATQCFF